MRDPRRPRHARSLGERLLSPRSRLQPYRWVILAVGVILEIVVILAVYSADAVIHPLDPAGSGIVLISVLVAGLGGALAGLASALVGVLTSFLLLLADFSNATAAANAVGSAVIWCVAATVTGLTVGYLRREVARREGAFETALKRSADARRALERILDFSPRFHHGGDHPEVARVICATAVETFGADGARLYAVEHDQLRLLGLAPKVPQFAPGLTFPLTDYPEVEDALASRRPSFVRDIRQLRLRGTPLKLQSELGIISAIRVPVLTPAGVAGMLSLSWKHAIERPSEELLAIIQRFADQAAIAWQSALQYEAQQEAEKLRDALDRVLALAPTFHITGSREAVADAICEAAVETFGCSAAALYRVGGDRLCLLGRMPLLPGLQRGTTFPLRPEMPLARELSSRAPVFIPDVTAPDRFPHPLPAKVIAQAKTRSALYLPLRPGPRGPRNLLVLTWNQAREQPDKDFLAVFQRFADQVALALANASAERLHARLEASLLPALLPVHPRFQVFTRYRTGEQRLRLGGDFVGTVVSDDGWLHFIIGDVSGHGPDAAALGANLRSTWRALVLAGTSLQKTLEIMHRILTAERSEANIFVTLLAGRLSPQGDELALVNVGHPPPLLATGRVTALAATPVPPLGFANCERWPVRRFRLPEHWSLLCYTDGLIDARVEPESAQRFGEERLREHLAAHLSGLQSPDTGREAAAAAQAGIPPSTAQMVRIPVAAAQAATPAAEPPLVLPDERYLDQLLADVEAANGGPFADDVALLLISTRPVG